MTFVKKVNIEPETKSVKEEPKEKKWFKAEGKLTVDAFETDSEIIIQSAVAGIKSGDFDISIENDVLEIRGIRKNPLEGKTDQDYFFQECYWGPFSRQIILPKEVDTSKVQALIKEGILIVTIPKLKKERKKKVRLKEEE